MKTEDILHKTTYVWKDEEGFAIIIKNNGSKVILNMTDSCVWKCINDEDTVEDIIAACQKIYALDKKTVINTLERMVEAGLITNEDLFWGDDIL